MIEWTEEWSVGNLGLDVQHRRLANLINRVIGLVGRADGDVSDQFHEALHDACQYADKHFRDEERLMRVAGFAEIQSHMEEHDDFQKQLLVLLMDGTYGNIDAKGFATFLKNWFEHHVLAVDMKYKPALIENHLAD